MRAAYDVQFAASAARFFRKLEPPLQRRLARAIDALAINPRPYGVVKLTDEDDLYRLRVGEYRIVYKIQDSQLIVLIVAVGHRRDIYR
jgi:mRNA interferase RelE/StbE